MRAKVKSRTFNNKEVELSIEFYFDGGFIINKNIDKENSIISENVYNAVNERTVNFLKDIFPDFNISFVDFKVISRDLENLKELSIVPDTDDLSEKLFNGIVELLKEELNTNELSKKKNEFKAKYLNIKNNFLKNKNLERILQLIEDKKITDAKKLSDSIDISKLNSDDNYKLNFLRFTILLINSDSDSEKIEKIFRKKINICKNNPELVKSYYFKYIKFLENCRVVRKPRKLIEEFEKRYPLSMLSNDEMSLYYYLKGRAEYLRGEFIVALNFLVKSLENADKNNYRHIAAVYNTSINPFNDNLFFKEAEFIAQKALKLRENLALPEKQETISALGGVAFKSGDFEKAFEYYRLSEKQLSESVNNNKNRLYNYIVKSAVMLENYEIAEEYLAKLRVIEDKKGFSKMTELLFLLKKENYSDMNEVFKNSIMLLENHDAYDYVAIAWGYTFMALAEFKQKKFKSGVKYLSDAIEFFLGDLYIMEAYYVSLYLYSYSVPLDYIKFFRKLEPDISLIKQFEDYMEKHSGLRENFYKYFIDDDMVVDEMSNLEIFYNDTKDINDENYDWETVDKIMNKFCLI